METNFLMPKKAAKIRRSIWILYLNPHIALFNPYLTCAKD